MVRPTPQAVALAAAAKPGWSWHRMQHRYAPYLFVLPFILIFGTFGLYPMLNSIYLSFFVTSGPQEKVFVGIDNFTTLLQDADFWKAVRNTVIFAFFSVFLQLPLALFLSVLLNSTLIKGRNFFRFVFFSPYLMGLVFAAILFNLLFADKVGMVNSMMYAVTGREELRDLRWLSDSAYVMPAMVILALWIYTGFNMIYFLAALQAVEEQLYEAADVDGANIWHKFWHVTLPGIKPVLVFVVVFSTIGSMRLFELPWLLLNQGSGPDQAGLTIVMYLYQNGFVIGDLGYASAIGWTLALGILGITLLQVKLSGTTKMEQ